MGSDSREVVTIVVSVSRFSIAEREPKTTIAKGADPFAIGVLYKFPLTSLNRAIVSRRVVRAFEVMANHENYSRN